MLICPVCQSVYPPGEADRCPRDGSPLYALGDGGGSSREHLAPGAVIANKYELIEELIHRTGPGRTFKARQLRLNRDVDLRVLPADAIITPLDQARFTREVATWGRVRSEHVVRLFDSGFTEHRSPYMALEATAGGTFGDRLRAEGAQPPMRVYLAAEHILEALTSAHEVGVLHRDITPDALMLGEQIDGELYVRLSGFGLAKHLGEGDDDPTAITMTGQVVGSPAYMAPETVLQGWLEPRTDLYALGVVLYELLAGRTPVQGGSLSDMLAFYVNGAPEPLSMSRPDLPRDLSAFVDRLMHREPDGRPPSARAALDELRLQVARPSDEPMAHLGEPPVRDEQPFDIDLSIPPTMAEASIDQRPSLLDRGRWLWILAGCLGLGLIGGAVWSALR